MGEDDGGDVGVVEFCILEFRAAEEAVGEVAAGGDGDGGEFDFAADVAEGVYVVDVGVLILVCYYLAAFVLLDACFLETEVFDFGGAADGPEEGVEIECSFFGLGIGVVEFEAFFCFFEFGLGGVAVDDEALALVFGHDFVLDHGVEGAEEFVVADEEMGFAAEVVEHACHFNGDVAGAY